MAFFAIVALFVSPVLAWNCCCTAHASTSSPHSLVQNLAVESTSSGAHSCCPSEMAPAVKSETLSKAKSSVLSCAIIQNVCHCEEHSPEVFTLSDQFSSFQFAPVILVATPPATFSPIESERLVTYFGVTARPRGPDNRTRSTRGPPTSLLS